MVVLSKFHSIAPRFRKKQEEGLLWLVEAHVQSERTARGLGVGTDASLEEFRHRMMVGFRRFGCNPPRVAYRSHELSDFNHFDWPSMEIFRLNDFASGRGMDERMSAFQKGAERAFTHWYEKEGEAPTHLIHVSCTGYLSPSSAQRIVMKKNWEDVTTVTHVYHMGCYAAFPAIRVGEGYLAKDPSGNIDVAHTELCTIHLNPSEHEPENMVMQSLFADGMIRYRLQDEKVFRGAGLKLLALHEEQIPDSAQDMTWIPGATAMHMTLSKEVPQKIARNMQSYVRRLLEKAQIAESSIPELHYAIHPGGPKIIDQIEELLHLHSDQVFHSREVLAHYGNMSSATLPHVWEACLESPKVKPGQRILSMAFGPGLTISGAVFEKVAT